MCGLASPLHQCYFVIVVMWEDDSLNLCKCHIHHHAVNLLIYKATLCRLWFPFSAYEVGYNSLPSFFACFDPHHLSRQFSWAEREGAGKLVRHMHVCKGISSAGYPGD